MTTTTKKKMLIHLLRNFSIVVVTIAVALYCGMLGYHLFAGLPWVDSFLNAAMILSGMGPVTTLATSAGKIFAGCYALFSGLVFIAIIALMLSPFLHHFFRKIQIE